MKAEDYIGRQVPFGSRHYTLIEYRSVTNRYLGEYKGMRRFFTQEDVEDHSFEGSPRQVPDQFRTPADCRKYIGYQYKGGNVEAYYPAVDKYQVRFGPENFQLFRGSLVRLAINIGPQSVPQAFGVDWKEDGYEFLPRSRYTHDGSESGRIHCSSDLNTPSPMPLTREQIQQRIAILSEKIDGFDPTGNPSAKLDALQQKENWEAQLAALPKDDSHKVPESVRKAWVAASAETFEILGEMFALEKEIDEFPDGPWQSIFTRVLRYYPDAQERPRS